MNELLIRREAKESGMLEDLESSYVERLEELWWKLSEAEQDEMEMEISKIRAL